MRWMQYGSRFQEIIKEASKRSAQRVVPLVMELAEPASVIDVGCGTGAWLSVFRERGVTRILGIDGDYVDRKSLLIPPECFLGRDLTQPLGVGERFDLVMSMEVAEHLPAESAPRFVDTLTSLGDVILFSAAIPNQTGVGHVNEQWPEYWKALFAARGYEPIDCIRHRIWGDQAIEPWYRQNALLYVRSSALDVRPRLREARDANRNQILSVVHPEMFYPLSVPQLAGTIPGTLRRAVRRLFGRTR